MLWLRDPESYISAAQAAGELPYLNAVAAIASRGQLLWRLGLRGPGRRLLSAVAYIDNMDDLVGRLADECRLFLESRHLPTLPSHQAANEQRLADLPPYDRSITLARMALSRLGGVLNKGERRTTLRLAVHHFEAAASIRPLPTREQRILEGLRARLSA
jgi:hypothetical protein